MKRFKFPFAYEPKVNVKNTIIYSSILKNKIFEYLNNKYKCVYVDPAMVVDNKQSSLAYVNGDRVISFDNKPNNSIFMFNSAQDNYLLLLSNTFKNQHIATFTPFIRRDAKQTNLDSIINWEIAVELSMPINLNIDYFATLIRETYAALTNIANSNDLKSIHVLDKHKSNTVNFAVIDAQKIESLYPTLTLEEAFTHYCSEHKFVIVQNNIKKLRSGKTLSAFIPTAQDSELSCGLYVYDEINNKPIHLINVCKRPEGIVSKNQLLDTNPYEITNELYDSRIFEKDHPTNISLVINFTNLLFFFLDKVHLAEVVKSVWPDEFIDFVNKEKIEIF
ncbi:MAG: hypothetical protein ACOQNV_01565 [Mycoplasmoidaceae bacterium]